MQREHKASLTSKNKSCSVDTDSAGCTKAMFKAKAVAIIPAPICINTCVREGKCDGFSLKMWVKFMC